jgi:hypothetical protein
MTNPTYTAAVAASLATLTRVSEPAAEPLDFGVDVHCLMDCRDDFAEVDEHSPEAIVEALVRRFVTPRGTMLDAPDYGLDIRAWCNRGATLTELRLLSSQMSAEARKDDRVDSVDVAVSSALSTQRLEIKLVVTPADPALATFAATFAVTSAGVLLDTLNTTAGAA